MPEFTLDQINEAADRKFGPFVVTGVPGGDVTLLNPLRMPKDKRRKLTDLQKVVNDDDTDPDAAEAGLCEMVRLIAKTAAEANRLLKEFGDDQAKLAVLLEEYGRSSQTGEASPLPS